MLMLVAPEDNPDIKQNPMPFNDNETAVTVNVHTNEPTPSEFNNEPSETMSTSDPVSNEDSPMSSDTMPSTNTAPSEYNNEPSETMSTSDPVSNEDSPMSSDTMPSTNTAPKKPKSRGILKVLIIVFAIAGIAAIAGGAFLLGKQHEKVLIQAPPTQPVNLPPQAIVLTACVPGRGKQFIIPKDIPNGPIYDVVSSKVIAIEFNFSVAQLFANSDDFSKALLSTTKSYPVNHFSILPATPISPSVFNGSPASSAALQQALSNVHLIEFMVSKDYSNSITCGATTTK
jgi:hypothetical protein